MVYSMHIPMHKVQNVGEIIKGKEPAVMTNIKTRAKQQENDVLANKTSNNQQQKETTGNGQKREKMEEPKYSNNEQQGEDSKAYNFRSTSTRAKLEIKNRGKER